MTVIATFDGFESPFDDIKEYDETGEFWRARKLQELVEYDTWQRFSDAIERARLAMINIGQDPDVEAAKITSPKVGEQVRYVDDYRLSRYGAYMVVMNCDPRQKPRVAEAQSYFAIKTREAELGLNEMPKDYPAALRAYASAIEDALEAKKKVKELEPKAEEYDAYMDSDGNLSWTALAKALYNENSPKGRNLVVRKLREHKIIMPVYTSRRAEPYQEYINKGWFIVRTDPPYYKPQTFTLPFGHSQIYRLLKNNGEDVTEPKDELKAES